MTQTLHATFRHACYILNISHGAKSVCIKDEVLLGWTCHYGFAKCGRQISSMSCKLVTNVDSQVPAQTLNWSFYFNKILVRLA